MKGWMQLEIEANVMAEVGTRTRSERPHSRLNYSELKITRLAAIPSGVMRPQTALPDNDPIGAEEEGTVEFWQTATSFCSLHVFLRRPLFCTIGFRDRAKHRGSA